MQLKHGIMTGRGAISYLVYGTAWVIAVFFILAGISCGTLLPQQRTEAMSSAEKISAQHSVSLHHALSPLTRALEKDPQRSITVTSESQVGGETDFTAEAARKIPLSVGLAIGAFATGMFAFGLLALRRSSKIGHAADESIASLIRLARNSASSVKDEVAKANLLNIVGEAESARGKLRNGK